MFRVEKTITAYGDGDGFVMEIQQFRNNYTAWIFHVDYGIKKYMFGIPGSYMTQDEFEALALANFKEHKNLYRIEVMQEKC